MFTLLLIVIAALPFSSLLYIFYIHVPLLYLVACKIAFQYKICITFVIISY